MDLGRERCDDSRLPGGKDPIQLGEKQPYTKESILHVWDWSKSDKSRPLDASCESFSVSPDGKWIVTDKGERINVATGKANTLPNFEPHPRKILFSRRRPAFGALAGWRKQDGHVPHLRARMGKKLCEIENQWPAHAASRLRRQRQRDFPDGEGQLRPPL